MTRRPRLAWHQQADRTRKLVTVTISDEAREALDELAVRSADTKSGVVERLILDAHMGRAWSSAQQVVSDGKGNILPTDDAWDRVTRAYPGVSQSETFQRAQALTIAELVQNAHSALKRPRKKSAANKKKKGK